MEAQERDLHGGHCVSGKVQLSLEKPRRSSEHFAVEDLLNLSNDESFGGGDEVSLQNASPRLSTVAIIDRGSNSSCSNSSGANACLPESLAVPQDEIAELEWLSNFMEESFATEHFQKLHLNSPKKISSTTSSSSSSSSSQNPNQTLQLSGKVRAKRNRPVPTSCSSSRLLILSPENSCAESEPEKKIPKKMEAEEEGRRCLHCDTDKTPQWRAGPMGPKTLCNACGVRYKSGRLVPEYRPAASPTFSLSEHSNSHRKVLELRRVKEQQQTSRTGQCH